MKILTGSEKHPQVENTYQKTQNKQRIDGNQGQLKSKNDDILFSVVLCSSENFEEKSL